MRVATVTMMILLVSAAAAAPPRDAAASSPLAKLAGCRAIADETARLACFDATADQIAAAASKNDLVVMDREDIQQTRRGLFGFSLPKLPFFGGGKEDGRARIEPIEQVESTITNVRSYGSELWRLSLADESVWETTEPFRATVPQRGDTIAIKRNGIGTYFLKVAGGKAVKAVRRR